MNLKLTEPENSDVSISHDSDRSKQTSDTNLGQIMSLIDGKKKRIEYNRNIFSAELASVPRKRKNIISNIIINIAIMIVVSALFFYMSSHSALGLGFFLGAFTYIFIVYMLIRIIRYIRLYIINTDCNFSRNYRIKHGVNTLVNEEEYCSTILSKLAIYEGKISDMEHHISANEPYDSQAYVDELTRIPDDFDDFKYSAGRLQF